MNEDEYRQFLEHKLRKLNFIISTSPGIHRDMREALIRVIQADSHVGIETEGEQ
jgi:hypothetical protein